MENNKMASNNESIRLLKMKINRPQNIDASYATMYEGEDSSHEGETKYNVEENHNEGDLNEGNHDVSEEGNVPEIAIEEALPPPPKLIEGETEKIEGENELDASINNVEWKYVQDMPSSSETWSERVDIFNGSKDSMKAVPESMLPQDQFDQKEPADEDEKELEVIDSFIDEEHGDDIDETIITAEGERQESEEDEQGDAEAVEDKEEIENEGDDNNEEEGGDDEEMVDEEVEEEDKEKEQEDEQEDAPEGEVDENQQQQQQDIVAMEAGKASAPDITPELVSWCKNPKWHPNEGFNHCSNSKDIPQAGVDDEKFQQMFFFDTLVECCQKFFHSDECEHEDMCAALNVLGEEEGIAFERQADSELEDEVPGDEGQPGDGTEEEAAEEEEEEVANEEEEGEDTSDEGVQLDENETTSWEGFDEDMTHQTVIREPEQPSSWVEAHDLSEAQGKDDYEGDGFGTMKYKLLRGKGEGGKSSANPFTTLGSGALMAAILLILSCCCLCYRRYRRRRYALSKRPNRGNYAALGRDDFFNGTFSDDVSYGKDSDDDVSIESYGSDDGGHETNLEMGGFHELDANGGLTLEEING
eukprot:CAMPEP_0201686554 /NCGR_PEP_ID=MMETSP0578-20130828/956_1 /ASSEMBLY_ACC=CAM_ASM_000663 /TAXON_ID=267565 /ORGANISM="Skeletonema grethea, Strain CCMP 1804" /LENGTH=586 /DNA_ID=CAMNT_0048170621 /DNA_START=229 /DNA_END=1989 /DNA_ORIENTATION=-